MAEEKGYFAAEGLDYVFRELVQATDGKIHDRGRPGRGLPVARGGPRGRRELRVPLDGRASPRPPATASSTRTRTPWRRPASSCRADSPVRTPDQLADVPISVGYQSGSHYSTIQALEPYLSVDRINLSFNDGMLFRRMELLIDGQAPAAALFSGPYYFAEQLGFRKIIDTDVHDHDDDPRAAGSRGPAAVLPGAPARAAGHRRPARSLHALLPERVPGALPSAHGHPALGSRRAHRVRALHQGGLRPDGPVDRRARASSPRAAWARASTSSRSRARSPP